MCQPQNKNRMLIWICSLTRCEKSLIHACIIFFFTISYILTQFNLDVKPPPPLYVLYDISHILCMQCSQCFWCFSIYILYILFDVFKTYFYHPSLQHFTAIKQAKQWQKNKNMVEQYTRVRITWRKKEHI